MTKIIKQNIYNLYQSFVLAPKYIIFYLQIISFRKILFLFSNSLFNNKKKETDQIMGPLAIVSLITKEKEFPIKTGIFNKPCHILNDTNTCLSVFEWYLFLNKIYHLIGRINAFIPKSFSLFSCSMLLKDFKYLHCRILD